MNEITSLLLASVHVQSFSTNFREQCGVGYFIIEVAMELLG